MAQKDGGPAFPRGVIEKDYLANPGEPRELRCTNFGFVTDGGMSLRDYFAGQALAFWAGARIGGWTGDLAAEHAEDIARHAYILANAMLVAREAQS